MRFQFLAKPWGNRRQKQQVEQKRSMWRSGISRLILPRVVFTRKPDGGAKDEGTGKPKRGYKKDKTVELTVASAAPTIPLLCRTVPIGVASMQRSVRFPGAIVLIAFASIALAQSAAHHDVLIKNAIVMTATHGNINSGSVYVKDGKIAAVGLNVAAPSGVTVIDAQGKY